MDSLEEQLFIAISNGDINSVQHFIQGANVNVICSSGRTPLGVAAQIGNISILQVLLSNSVVALPKDFGKKGRDHLKHHCTNQTDNSQQDDTRNLKCALDSCHKDSSTRNGSKCFDFEPRSDVSRHAIESMASDAANKSQQNLGYFIVVHKDRNTVIHSSNTCEGQGTMDENLNQGIMEVNGLRMGSENLACALNDVRTPDGMDKLEWDVEVEEKEKAPEDEDDSWADMYRWYADILDRTSSLLLPPHQCDFNHQDFYGRCAVHYAAEEGHEEAIRMLTAAGCRVDIGDSDNLTPLHLAAARNYPQVARLLLKAGAEVNRKTSDKTSALHIAAARGFLEMAEVLLDGGANIDSLDASDRTPLLLAASRGHTDVVALLIKYGAKVNIEEIHGFTPLCEAVWQKLVPLVQLLLSAGAKLTQSHYLLHYAIMHRHLEMAQLLVKAGSIVNLRDDKGDTPLIIAARTGRYDLAELLLQNGAAVNYPNALTGSMPLHEAVVHFHNSFFSSFEAMFHLFRSYGAILNMQTCTGGDTPLHRAICLEKYQAAALLIRHGTDVNMCNVESCVVDNLCLARKSNNFSLVRMIVFAGFDLQRCTPDLIHLPRPDSSHPPDQLHSWLNYMKYNPMPLVDLCRLVIRRQLSENVYKKIKTSCLPYTLKKYILLEDIEVANEVRNSLAVNTFCGITE